MRKTIHKDRSKALCWTRRGLRAPAWVREIAVSRNRGTCASCDGWGELRGGLCVKCGGGERTD
jgi:hypothetical protein